MEATCPQCHVQVKDTDFFCYNCGKSLKPKRLSTSVGTQIMYYLGSVVLPPMGIVWGIRYLRQADQKSKLVGWALIILTFVTILLVSIWTVQFINSIQATVNTQLQGIEGF